MKGNRIRIRCRKFITFEAAFQFGKDNPQTGPFYIEGARPGDVLAVYLPVNVDGALLDAYQLCSQAGEANVAQVVDPNYTVVAMMNKKYLPHGSVMGGVHEKLKSRER